MMALYAGPVAADPLRIATFNTELSRDGPGLLLRDILRGDDPQILAVADTLKRVAPDIVVLQGFDHDLENAALAAFAALLGEKGAVYPHTFARQPNSGMASGVDLDGDGRKGDARDAQGFGKFSGQGGMAILSKHPIAQEKVQDFSSMLWRDMPAANLPVTAANLPFPSAEAWAIQRLSSTAHWAVPVDTPQGRLWLLTFHASPPVFDGPEDRNGKRNHDEIAFWSHYLDGAFGPAPSGNFVILGDANNDPDRGEGLKPPLLKLLNDPRLTDPLPGRITVDWPDPEPGDMRVDYVLPSADLTVRGAGVEPAPDASRHALVWVDVD